MDKYKDLRGGYIKVKRFERMCLNKKAYSSKEESYIKGQKSYLCPHCKKWHRSGKINRFIRKITKNYERL